MPSVAEPFETQKLNLAAEIARSGRGLRMRVFGTSMIPTLWPGDTVRIAPAHGRQIERGDVVLVEREGRFFVHRVVGRMTTQGDRRWLTRGDAMPQNDPPVAESDVLGVVAGVEREAGLIEPGRKISRSGRMFGWMMGHSELFRRVALRLHAGTGARNNGLPQRGSKQAGFGLPSR